MAENWNCNGAGPHASGEVRILPTGGDSNAILCRLCFSREISYRATRNVELGRRAFDTSKRWADCKVYDGGGPAVTPRPVDTLGAAAKGLLEFYRQERHGKTLGDCPGNGSHVYGGADCPPCALYVALKREGLL